MNLPHAYLIYINIFKTVILSIKEKQSRFGNFELKMLDENHLKYKLV